MVFSAVNIIKNVCFKAMKKKMMNQSIMIEVVGHVDVR
jgi:hypothetical protein